MNYKKIKCIKQCHQDDWTIYQGDSIEIIKSIPDEQIGLSIFSPPFPGMYVYSNSMHDIGNTKTIEELVEICYEHILP